MEILRVESSCACSSWVLGTLDDFVSFWLGGILGRLSCGDCPKLGKGLVAVFKGTA